MSRQLLINGVPDCLKFDGWWLEIAPTQAEQSHRQSSVEKLTGLDGAPLSSILVIVLVLLADFLFWDSNPGISIAIYAITLSAAMLISKRKDLSRKQWMLALGFELLCNLPVIEYVQFISVMFSLLGVTVLATWCVYDHIRDWWQVARTSLRLPLFGPIYFIRSAILKSKKPATHSSLRAQASGLVLPLTVGFVFLYVLSFANPFLDTVLHQLGNLDWLDGDLTAHLLFWFFIAALIWPCLNLDAGWLGIQKTKRTRIAAKKTQGILRIGSIVTETSVRNSLVLFNLLFLVQTITDIGFLSGGMSLPEGMTYAKYAHRGAYPLVITALLAGAFAIVTHKHIAHNRILRALLFLWLGQNLLLVMTAAFRLYIYVDVYSLTYMRIAAFIWMDLVFVGLLLLIEHIHNGRSIHSMIGANLSVLFGVLYLCSFVNFADLIASYNLRTDSSAPRTDVRYICKLGEQALPAVLEWEAKHEQKLCHNAYRHTYMNHVPITNWREWGFRRWHLQSYLNDA